MVHLNLIKKKITVKQRWSSFRSDRWRKFYRIWGPYFNVLKTTKWKSSIIYCPLIKTFSVTWIELSFGSLVCILSSRTKIKIHFVRLNLGKKSHQINADACSPPSKPIPGNLSHYSLKPDSHIISDVLRIIVQFKIIH